MSKERETAIKILSHLSPSIREAVAVYIECDNTRVVNPESYRRTIADKIRKL